MENKMRELRIVKVTLNMSFGNDQDKIEKGLILLERITNKKPVKTRARKRIPNWNIRPGLPIGCKVTLRGKNAEEVLGKLLESKEKKFGFSNFDGKGNMSFGIREYIDIPGAKYDPDLGILGLQACVTFERAGFRIKKRKQKKGKIGKKHTISDEDAIAFMKKKYNIEVAEE